jgi:hypothetical protein
VEVGVAKLKGKSKERMEWKPQAEIKEEGFLIGRLGTATFLERHSNVICKLFLIVNMKETNMTSAYRSMFFPIFQIKIINSN